MTDKKRVHVPLSADEVAILQTTVALYHMAGANMTVPAVVRKGLQLMVWGAQPDPFPDPEAPRPFSANVEVSEELLQRANWGHRSGRNALPWAEIARRAILVAARDALGLDIQTGAKVPDPPPPIGVRERKTYGPKKRANNRKSNTPYQRARRERWKALTELLTPYPELDRILEAGSWTRLRAALQANRTRYPAEVWDLI